MSQEINIDELLAPIPGDNPAGEDIRYEKVLDDIKEARRSYKDEDPFDGKIIEKKAEWDRVIDLSVDTLKTRTKDLLIAFYLTEALIHMKGFKGFYKGLLVLDGFVRDLWDDFYPQLDEEEEDEKEKLEPRANIIGFLNKLSSDIIDLPLTDRSVAVGQSWKQWQDSRNDFESAVSLSNRAFYELLAEDIISCSDAFKALEERVDQKFGVKYTPSLRELGEAIEKCDNVVKDILEKKRKIEPDKEEHKKEKTVNTSSSQTEVKDKPMQAGAGASFAGLPMTDVSLSEEGIWKESKRLLSNEGINKALGYLLSASYAAPSVRQKSRFSLFMAKLCLEAKRADLARPIVEELYASIEQLDLTRWESPLWIAEIYDALYQCLTTDESSDVERATELFQKLCKTDVTKAIPYKLE